MSLDRRLSAYRGSFHKDRLQIDLKCLFIKAPSSYKFQRIFKKGQKHILVTTCEETSDRQESEAGGYYVGSICTCKNICT